MTRAFPVLAIAVSAAILFASPPAGATGLYEDLPHWYLPADTSAISLDVGQSLLDRDAGRASVFEIGITSRRWRRGVVRAALLYPAMQTGAGVVHGGGDGFIRASWRAWGDTLDTRGLFARGELRVPMGSNTFYPFSLGSLDGGGGLEARLPLGMLRLRAAAVYTLVGERRKTGDRIHRNHLATSVLLGFDPGESTECGVGVFVLSFRGGDTREVYLFTLRRRVAGPLWLSAHAAVDAGSDSERVFNTLGGITFEYRFGGGRPAAGPPPGGEGEPRDGRASSRPGSGK
ncbi:MAG: hypothetical protein JW876_03410 [Candidatus Krumholzibacteriota bacterium]|nr:hypothetical protein [Candidatus Krumholzibacteriota bacterium]